MSAPLFFPSTPTASCNRPVSAIEFQRPQKIAQTLPPACLTSYPAQANWKPKPPYKQTSFSLHQSFTSLYMWFAVLDNYLTIKEANKTPKVVMTKTIETLAVHTIIPTFISMRFKLVSIFVARITNISYFHRHENSIHLTFLNLSDSVVVSFSPFVPSFIFASLFISPISYTPPLIPLWLR